MRPGGGGTWRAFVRQSAMGEAGCPDLHAIALKYKQAVETGTLGDVKMLGKAATKYGKLMRITGSKGAFFKNSRVVLTQKWKAEQVGFYKAHKDSSLPDLILAIMRHVPRDCGINAEQLAKAFVKHKAAEERANVLAGETLLAAYADNAGAVAEHLSCVPHDGLNMFEVLPCNLVDRCEQGVAWLSNHPQTNLGSALDSVWQQLHQTVDVDQNMNNTETHCPDEEEGEGDEGEASTRCMALGVCICSASGQKLHKCRNRFLKLLKESFFSTTDKRLLGDAQVVCRVSLEPFGNRSVASIETGSTHWLHVGFMSWKPYRPSVHALLELSKCPDHIVMEQEYIYLQACLWEYPFLEFSFTSCLRESESCCLYGGPQASGCYMTEYSALSKLDLDKHWHLHFFQLVTIASPVLALRPAYVAVTAMKAASCRFWPAERKQKQTQIPEEVTAELDDDDEGWGSIVAHIVDGGEGDANHDMAEVDEGLQNLQEAPELDAVVPEDLLDRVLEECLEDRIFSNVLDDEEPVSLHCAEALDASHEDDVFTRSTAHEHIHSEAPDVAATVEAEVIVGQTVHAATPAVSGPKHAAEAIVHLSNGSKIAYHESKGAFECVCGNALHGKCVLTRTARGHYNKKEKRTVAGRPLGFLACWAADSTCLTRSAHWDKTRWEAYSKEARELARMDLLTYPTGEHLASFERELDADEGEEPTSLVGLLK
eukprot:6485926-Amphidinium_carterae.1